MLHTGVAGEHAAPGCVAAHTPQRSHAAAARFDFVNATRRVCWGHTRAPVGRTRAHKANERACVECNTCSSPGYASPIHTLDHNHTRAAHARTVCVAASRLTRVTRYFMICTHFGSTMRQKSYQQRVCRNTDAFEALCDAQDLVCASQNSDGGRVARSVRPCVCRAHPNSNWQHYQHLGAIWGAAHA
jgi:hypothetical protein